MTAQELSLFPDRTVWQNLTLLNTPKRFHIFEDRVAARSRAMHALERVSLASLLDVNVSELSDNQKYMVEFAKALLYMPRILVLDEITSALRREEVSLIGNILKEMARAGCIIAFISHRMNEIFDMCTSITVLRNGEVVNNYQIDEATEHILLTDMIGSEPDIRHQQDTVPIAIESGSNQTALAVKGLEIQGFSGATIDLEIRQGEILGIAGLQGQGQSHLLKQLFSLFGPIKLQINNQQKRISNPVSAISNGIGYLTGDRVRDGIFAGRSIAENLDLVNNIVLGRRPLDNDQVLQKYKVKYKSSALPIETLSGGNQQKVVLSRWTSVSPVILLADDPTKGIDVSSKLDVYEIFRQMALRGSAIIFVSSEDEELVKMAEETDNYSVAVMYNGRFVRRLYGAEITTSNIISASIAGARKIN